MSDTRAGAGEPNADLRLQTVADIGAGSVGEDGFFFFFAKQAFSWRGFELVLSAPMQLRIVDNAPQDVGVLRRQDWDERSDFARIAPVIAYAKHFDGGFVTGRLGELDGVTLGQGAAVDTYFNSVDMDHYQGGLHFVADLQRNGLELLVEDVLAPDILAGRVFLVPFAWFLDAAWSERIEIGYTLAADIAAPRGPSGGDTTSIVVTGGDVSWRVVDRDWLTVMPYGALMGMDGSAGLHAGLAFRGDFLANRKATIGVRGEYRRVGADYHPALFNPFYERHRWFYDEVAETGRSRSLADQLAARPDLPARNGFMAEASLTWKRGVRAGVRYDTEGSDRLRWMMLRLDLFPWDRFSISGFYASEDVNGHNGLFTPDALLSFAARARIYGPIDLFFEVTRRYRRIGSGSLRKMDFANEIGGGLGLSAQY